MIELLDELQIMADAANVEPLEAVIRTLEEHLRFLRETPEGYRYGRVFVGGIEEARAMRFRLVAIPGLNEGDFPRLITGDPLLADDRKRALGLAVEDEKQEQLLLRTALACASERVVASYSEVDLLSGRKRVLSLYAAELMKAARGSDLDIKRLEEEAGSRPSIAGRLARAEESAGRHRRCRVRSGAIARRRQGRRSLSDESQSAPGPFAACARASLAGEVVPGTRRG